MTLLKRSLTSYIHTTMTSTKVLSCDPSSISFPSSDSPVISSPDTLASLTTAAHHLTHLLQPVAFPTETVYGLGAPALNPTAVARIFAAKGRPSDNPLIVHISSHTMLRSLLPHDYRPSKSYRILMDRFWPGPLTLLFPRNPDVVPDIVSASHPTVAVRFPAHPVARALIAITDTPIAAPSANSSGKPSPTRAEHVLRDLGGHIGLILDGGPCDVGLESTVVDGLSQDSVLRILRPGGVTVEEIETVLAQERINERVLVHQKDYQDTSIELAPTTPGMKYRHYSPSVPVILLLTQSPPPTTFTPPSWDTFVSDMRETLPVLRKMGILSTSDSPLARSSHIKGVQRCHYSLGPSSTPAIAAHRLFDGLIALEQQGVDVILVEEFKEERQGLAIMNRLRKAAGQTQWVSFS